MKKIKDCTFSIFLSVILIFSCLSSIDKVAYSSELSDVSEEADEFSLMNYSAYYDFHESKGYPSRTISIEVGNISQSEGVEIENNFLGKQGEVAVTDESGFVEYSFDVQESGLYNINLDYYPLEGKGSDILRILKINGHIPFEEARELVFKRVYTDETEIQRDERDNDIRPSQIENPFWINVDVRDSMGYYNEPLSFYLEAGVNSLRFESIREPMAIGRIVLYKAEKLESYENALL